LGAKNTKLEMVVTIKLESLKEYFSQDPLLERSSRKILRLRDQWLSQRG
jgi:hypothetical protein